MSASVRSSPFLLLLLLAGCADPPPMPPDGPPAPATSDLLFGDSRVWDVAIELSDDAIDSLTAEPRTYVDGNVTVGNIRIEHVGVRLKGAYSFQDLRGKASFKIKLNHFQPQEVVGLEKLTLNAMNQDRAQLHERLAYQVFNAAGVAAPRTGFARVTVNGHLYGLYANVESIDDEFLDDRFVDGNGNLYEAPWTADLIPDKVEKFNQDEGRDQSRADLNLLVEVANRPDDEIFFGKAQLLDTPAFLGQVASETAVGHWDGYWKANNYFIYHELTADQWSFLPWGVDQTFDKTIPVFSGRGFLIAKCMASPRCLAEYAAVGMAVADQYEALDLEGQIDRLSDLVEGTLQEDERRKFPVDQVRRYRQRLRAYVETTPERLRRQFDCIVDDQEADLDGDGFGACLQDCDDSDPAIHPGAAEICDDRDNDCDGWVDNAGSCGCQQATLGDETFLFCDHAQTWTRAAAQCQAQRARLAVPENEAESAALFAMTQQLAPGDWYIGLSDRGTEQSWLEAPLTPDEGDVEPPMLHWAAGEPDDWGGEDCAVLTAFGDGAWADVSCDNGLPYVCRVAGDAAEGR